MNALINKETLQAICEAKRVTCAYIAKKTKYEENRIVKWSNPSDALRPTFVQAKKIAKCLHVVNGNAKCRVFGNGMSEISAAK